MTALLDRPAAASTYEPEGPHPRWVRPSVAALLLGTALLYLWDLSASGWANSFYSAAVQAGAHSWKAMLFGSSDASSFITVDKPPAALWVMDLSARVFGVNAWSVLVPQALEGVASVGVLYLAVRRVAGPAAGLIAGVVLATTPVAALMFRLNNPDALLVLCLTGAVYATVRSLETASVRWLSLAGTLVGLGFLSKALQAFLVVPVLALVYLALAPTGIGRRVRHVLVAGLALLVSGGWWVALIELWPAGSRPYIGGSQDNSFLSVLFGYNGFGRLTGDETGSVGGMGANGSRWGETGLLRLFDTEFGGQASWLLPAALVLLVGGLWLAWRLTAVRASLLLWGGWLVGTGLVLSLAQGIIHPYYTVVLAPALGGVIGIGAVELWRQRATWAARAVLAGALLVSAVWTYRLMARSATWHASLRPVLLLAGLAAAALVLWIPLVRTAFLPLVVGGALLATLSAPALAALETARQPHSGAIPSAAPSSGAVGPRGGPAAGGFRGGGTGGLLDAATPSAELVAALQAGASSYTWVAAAVGSNSAAGPQLASGEPVMAIGGFNGSDPTPTLAAFQELVAAKRIHWFLGGGGGMGMGVSGTAAAITAWVQQTFTAQTIGGTTVYDLTT